MRPRKRLVALALLLGVAVLSLFPYRAETPAGTFLRYDSETIWLARAIWTETKRPAEQRLVAWVIRHRVETEYGGSTYQEVVRAPHQFTGVHQRIWPDPGPSWQQALRVASQVRRETQSPFGEPATHFYSPRSMDGAPGWAAEMEEVRTTVDSNRFRFYR